MKKKKRKTTTCLTMSPRWTLKAFCFSSSHYLLRCSVAPQLESSYLDHVTHPPTPSVAHYLDGSPPIDVDRARGVGCLFRFSSKKKWKVPAPSFFIENTVAKGGEDACNSSRKHRFPIPKRTAFEHWCHLTCRCGERQKEECRVSLMQNEKMSRRLLWRKLSGFHYKKSYWVSMVFCSWSV